MGRGSSLSQLFWPRIPSTCKMNILTVGTLLVILSCFTTQISSRTNSRFLQIHSSPVDYLLQQQIERRRDSQPPPPPSYSHLINGNSPIFYIRLPPAPYVQIPGMGWISPHPYHSPLMGSMSSGFGHSGFMGPSGPPYGMKSDSSSKNVISLPLKFVSNGRPAIVSSPSKAESSPSKKGTSSSSSSGSTMNHIFKQSIYKKPSKNKVTELISGGKYSFNGKPNSVFIVNSPARVRSRKSKVLEI